MPPTLVMSLRSLSIAAASAAPLDDPSQRPSSTTTKHRRRSSAGRSSRRLSDARDAATRPLYVPAHSWVLLLMRPQPDLAADRLRLPRRALPLLPHRPASIAAHPGRPREGRVRARPREQRPRRHPAPGTRQVGTPARESLYLRELFQGRVARGVRRRGHD